MREYALFLNGVYDNVLQEILRVQAYLPDQILFLQPYKWARIVRLAEDPPTTEDPVRLFVSTTVDLATVHYVGEVVGWDDKGQLEGARLDAINRVIGSLQPDEEAVYMQERGTRCTNLLHVRRLKQLSQPFSVAELINDSKNEPLSTARTTSGGWQYVRNRDESWLAAYV
ncbi:MAG: hypothetical protein JXM73_21655 [Anaerolineae bacterium]|nr:hypothetical protein [Anaerolineae bacterium]